MKQLHILAPFLISYLGTALGQGYGSGSSCSNALQPAYPAPSLAPGFEAQLVATNLTKPRGMMFDTMGRLLVVQSGYGLTSLQLSDGGGDCVSVDRSHDIVVDSSLNHGIEMTADGRTLYASNPEAVYVWSYNPSTGNTTSSNSSVITGMSTEDHTTRTLLLSKKVNGTLIVTRGSTANIDPAALEISSGHSQVKAFDLLNQTRTYDFDTDGRILGWGLRNDVGVDEEPLMGGIYTVENSVDQMNRSGVDIHQDNPGEELNFLGHLNGPAFAKQGANFGYPNCFSVWNVSAIPNNTGLQVGSPFAIGELNSTNNDAGCAQTVPPRLVFQAHMAPLDIKFNPNGTVAWISFHGSWDRTNPSGYKVSAVDFANGDPTEPSNSTTALIDIMTNPDNSKCPDQCFRPAGLAWDSKGRLFMSSDSTGEIWVITESSGNGTANATPTGPPTASSTTGGGQGGTSSSPAPSKATKIWNGSWIAIWVALAVCCLVL